MKRLNTYSTRNILYRKNFSTIMTIINRYNRQEILPEISEKGQGMLWKRSVAIIGIGALGSVTASLLARIGIRKLLVWDRDIVEKHNLQRQMIFTEDDINKPKAAQATAYMQKVNSEITIEAETTELNPETIHTLKNYDLILDCTDNMETRFLINDFCVKNKIPWIYSSAVGTKGRLLTIVPEKTPCFRCLFSHPKPGSLETCDTIGVLNTITTTIAALQVTEAIKILTKQEPTKELLAYDVWTQQLDKIRVKRKRECLCCHKQKFDFLVGKEEIATIKLCGQGRVQIKGKKPNMDELNNRLEKVGKVKISSYGIYFISKETDFFLFNDGRCLIKAWTKEHGKSLYGKYVGN